MYYFSARFYDPEIGRFITLDPARDGLNWYEYCRSNPLVYVDRDGEVPLFVITGGIGALVGGGIEAYRSYRDEGHVDWGRVTKGAVVGGAATAYLATGSVVASTGSVMIGVGLTSSPTSGIVLWSGGHKTGDIAAQFASQHGLKTLEQTFQGRLLELLQSATNTILGPDKAYQLLRPLWENASASFVQSVDGTVYVFLNAGGISDTSVFMTIEYQILKEMGVEMVFHLVK